MATNPKKPKAKKDSVPVNPSGSAGKHTITGIHYSKQPSQTELRWNTQNNMGKDSARLKLLSADDPVRQRIYFFKKTSDDIPRGDTAQGTHAYVAKFNKVFDFGTATQAEKEEVRALLGDTSTDDNYENEFESAVLGAGYIGYVSSNGVIVIMGRNVKVMYSGDTENSSSDSNRFDAPSISADFPRTNSTATKTPTQNSTQNTKHIIRKKLSAGNTKVLKSVRNANPSKFSSIKFSGEEGFQNNDSGDASINYSQDDYESALNELSGKSTKEHGGNPKQDEFFKKEIAELEKRKTPTIGDDEFKAAASKASSSTASSGLGDDVIGKISKIVETFTKESKDFQSKNLPSSDEAAIVEEHKETEEKKQDSEFEEYLKGIEKILEEMNENAKHADADFNKTLNEALYKLVMLNGGGAPLSSTDKETGFASNMLQEIYRRIGDIDNTSPVTPSDSEPHPLAPDISPVEKEKKVEPVVTETSKEENLDDFKKRKKNLKQSKEEKTEATSEKKEKPEKKKKEKVTPAEKVPEDVKPSEKDRYSESELKRKNGGPKKAKVEKTKEGITTSTPNYVPKPQKLTKTDTLLGTLINRKKDIVTTDANGKEVRRRPGANKIGYGKEFLKKGDEYLGTGGTSDLIRMFKPKKKKVVKVEPTLPPTPPAPKLPSPPVTPKPAAPAPLKLTNDIPHPATWELDESSLRGASAGVEAAEGSGLLGDLAAGASGGLLAKATGKLSKVGGAIKSALPKAGKLLGKAAPWLAAGDAAYNGISDEAEGKKVENVGDIVPEGMLSKINPFEYAMRGGRYLGNKANEAYGAVSSKMGGSGSLGSDLYDKFNPDVTASPKNVTPIVPADKVEPKMQGQSNASKEIADTAIERDVEKSTQAAPTIINNNNTTSPAAAPIPQAPPMVQMSINNNENAYKNYIHRRFCN
jgi:hypothetical protein